MELRRNQMKYFSSDNMRLLSSLILSLSSKQSAMENKLINNWSPNVAYIKDESFVIYNELLYVCKISNADSTFDTNKWTCLAPLIDELSKSDVEAMLNLSSEELANLQTLIDDTTITTTKTNSSSKIYMDIQAAIAECKDDTLKQIAKKVSGSYKIATSTAEVTSTDYIYLISNGANYDLYVLVDSVPTRVGDTSIDLSEYVKTTDLADYMKTVDADGKFATITTVDGKIDKTNVLTAKNNSATDDQVYSAKAIDAELDGVVKKTDIVTSIDSTSTDDTVPSAKASYDLVDEKTKEIYSTEEQIVGTWIDGETIYRRVIQVNVTDSDTLIEMIVGRVVINQLTTDGTTTEEVTKNVTVPTYTKQVDLSSFNIKRITGLYGSAIADSGRSAVYCPCDYGLMAHCHIYYNYNNKLLHFRVGEQYATRNTTWDVVLEYTKQ